MLITWDPPKRGANLVNHKLDFADLKLEFFERAFVGPAKKGRWAAVGRLSDGRAVTVIFVPLGSEAISVISMRPASRKERAHAPEI